MPKHTGSDSSPENKQLDGNAEELDNIIEDSEGTDAASSSNADDSKKSEDEHKSLLDVVKDVVETDSGEDSSDDETDPKNAKGKKGDKKEDGESDDDDASSASEDGKSGKDSDKSPKKEDEGDVEFTEEELAKEKPSTQKRIRNLIGKLDESHSLVEELTPKAERFQQIDGFMSKYGISSEEAAEAFTIMALVKTNPDQALQRMRGHIATVSERIGDQLPPDLQQKVDDGKLDEESAKELSKARANARIEKERREQLENTTRETETKNADERHKADLSKTLNEWQSKVVKTDPDYQKKHGFIVAQIKSLIATNGVPKSTDDMVMYAEAAYKSVNQQLAAVIPSEPKREKRSIKGRHSSGPPAKQQPESVLDVVKQAVGK